MSLSFRTGSHTALKPVLSAQINDTRLKLNVSDGTIYYYRYCISRFEPLKCEQDYSCLVINHSFHTGSKYWVSPRVYVFMTTLELSLQMDLLALGYLLIVTTLCLV